MAVIGLVPGLTVEAANTAALGAGAKLVGSWSFKLAEKAMGEIEAQRPDMILLTGGTDGGDSATILHNARLLARSALSVPIVTAGNQAVVGEVCAILTSTGKEVRCAANVMPRSGQLAVDSAREEIRKLFMERITQAKGSTASADSAGDPTDADGRRRGALLGARGTEEERLGRFAGGGCWWSNDRVHSIGYGQPSGPQIVEQGLRKPGKRTVEETGIRFNARRCWIARGLIDSGQSFARPFPNVRLLVTRSRSISMISA
jgi:uncharacterized protein (TIGR01319 family)